MKIFVCYCLEALTGQSLLKCARHLSHEHENWSNTCIWAQIEVPRLQSWSIFVKDNPCDQTPLKESLLLLSLKLSHSSYPWHTGRGMGFNSFFGMGHYVHLMACLGGWYTLLPFHKVLFSGASSIRGEERGGREGRRWVEVKQPKLPISTGCSFYFSHCVENYLLNWMWSLATWHDTGRTELRFSKASEEASRLSSAKELWRKRHWIHSVKPFLLGFLCIGYQVEVEAVMAYT